MYKVVIVGDSSVGKTHFLYQYIQGKLPEVIKPTIGVDFMNKSVTIHETGNILRLSFFDTAGEEKYHAVTACHYRKAMGAIIVYDVTNRASFESVERWLKDVNQLADSDCVVLIIGNKADIDNNPQIRMRREVTFQEGKSLADQNNLSFFEVSAINNEGIDEAINMLAMQIIEKQKMNFVYSPSMPNEKKENIKIKKRGRFECCVSRGNNDDDENNRGCC